MIGGLRVVRGSAAFLAKRGAALDAALYPLMAGICVLASARTFYGYMLKQTGGEWSAPLDDVFIHFDYARATAMGHPFEWVPGNGYSSGNTSLLYPFVLAGGYLLGFREQRLMVWAAIVAMTATFLLLLVARRLFFRGPRGAAAPPDGWAVLSSYALPVVVLGVGALDWSLWSGMEVAFFLGVWAVALFAYLELEKAPPGRQPRAAWWLGLGGVALVVTRPEAAFTVVVFAVASARLAQRRGLRPALHLAFAAGFPSLVTLVLQSVANRVLTGEWSANGALVKLAINNPFLTVEEKLGDYTFNLSYAVLRTVEYHLSDVPAYGSLLPALAGAALLVPRTRGVATLLWAQILGWLALVALNGQVRWQNERYVMPAVAWMLVAAALGASALFRRRERVHLLLAAGLGAALVEAVYIATRPGGTAPTFRAPILALLAGGGAAMITLPRAALRGALAAFALFSAHQHQVSKMRDQKWFFGRASRNIRDQHITAGRFLKELKPNRVLVGDAGALMYASDLPGLDIIGLGGFHELPFARAGVHGLPATLELLERMAPEDLPQVLAIYPSWWGVLPTWFASDVIARFPVEGNVICGGYEKVIYRADWRVLRTGEAPRGLRDGERVVDTVDVADLVSEHQHHYVRPMPGGWTDMKILPDPASPERDLFDAGRRIAGGQRERFVTVGVTPGRPARLLLRTAPEADTRIRIRVNGVEVGTTPLAAAESWVEPAFPLPEGMVTTEMSLEIVNDGPGDLVDHHVWITQ